MKLDRNVNPDGRGKYALINLRTNKVEGLSGGKPGDQFFVIKYRDRFTHFALDAYARGITAYIREMDNRLTIAQMDSLAEYAREIRNEAEIAKIWGNRTPD